MAELGFVPPRAASSADVTICIPAWQAEAFIDRTLECARAQTHGALRILVSVDRGDDATEARCRRHAEADARVEVIAQRRRLGWSDNANALLAEVRTPFFFLYFHDDVIAPTYVERLREALLADPQAMSAHCDLERYGLADGIQPGLAYLGDAPHRLLDFLAAPETGRLLRSLARRAVLDTGLRFPAIAGPGFWRCHPFLLQLLAAGRALHVPEVLYRRWIRADGLTATWGVRALAPLLAGQAASARHCLKVIDDAAAGTPLHPLLVHALAVFIATWTRQEELRLGRSEPVPVARLSPRFVEPCPPAARDLLDPRARRWLAAKEAELATLEARFPSGAVRRHAG